MRKTLFFLLFPLIFISCEKSAQFYLQAYVFFENLECPTDLGDGMICDSAIFDRKAKEVRYAYSYDFAENMTREIAEQSVVSMDRDFYKYNLANGFHSSEDNVKAFIFYMKLAKFNLCNVFYDKNNNVLNRIVLNEDEYLANENKLRLNFLKAAEKSFSPMKLTEATVLDSVRFNVDDLTKSYYYNVPDGLEIKDGIDTVLSNAKCEQMYYLLSNQNNKNYLTVHEFDVEERHFYYKCSDAEKLKYDTIGSFCINKDDLDVFYSVLYSED